MKAWNPESYLRFGNERTQPARDLARRIEIEAPRSVVDLGCGPGNSTEILRHRWPEAELLGLDSSPDMLEQARKAHPDWQWAQADAAAWAAEGDGADVLFSNACLQWVPHHEELFPRLFRQVAAGGALAIQLPYHLESPLHQCVQETAGLASWVSRMQPAFDALTIETAGFYYDRLASQARRVDLWETHYLHVVEGAETVLDWIRSTGLRPFHAALAGEEERESFDEELLKRLRQAFPPQADGRVLLRFPRLFVVAYRELA